ncbi:hypothetical protein BDF14DRAFT_1823573 [Spinellus fusiger]|nr:hypothetical protein BDF14DRAFT_1823573 [Spinellus fusiger]
MTTQQKGFEDIGNSPQLQSPSNESHTITRMHPSLKRPRAPIACFRCHHKKVRCDGVHPNCTRCLSTGVLCAYPNSRRSRNTQPTNVDPFINNLSHLEARIRRIETDLESQRAIIHSVFSKNDSDCGMGRRFKEVLSLDKSNQIGLSPQSSLMAGELTSQMLKTEQEVQESRSILAQLRLRGEQKIARNKRAAAAAAVSTTTSNACQSAVAVTPLPEASNKEQGRVRSVHSSSGTRQKLKKSQQSIDKQKKQPVNELITHSYNNPPLSEMNVSIHPHYTIHSLHPSSALSPSSSCVYSGNTMLKDEYMNPDQFCVESTNAMVDWSLLQRSSSTEESVGGTSGMFLIQQDENSIIAQQHAAQLADIHKQHNGILSPTLEDGYKNSSKMMTANTNENANTFTLSNSPFIQPLNMAFNLAPSSSSSSSTTTESNMSSTTQMAHIPQSMVNDSCNNMFNLSTFMMDDMLTEDSHGLQSSMLSSGPSVWYC